MKQSLIVLFLSVVLSANNFGQTNPETFTLITEKSSEYQIYTLDLKDQFAVEELQRYLRLISDHELFITSEQNADNMVAVGQSAASSLGINVSDYTTDEEGFVKFLEPGRIVLAGNSQRATLYAVYDFLEELGCRWFAPNFEYYGENGGEFVPKRSSIQLASDRSTNSPDFTYRAKRVEEGWSITPDRLILMIDWLAKSRHNIFNMTIDYGGKGRIPYEKYREEIVPELKKRGLLLHVGGHNYSLFLPDGYFEEHPDWFGMNTQGKRVPMLSGRVNFNTSNPEAVKTFIKNCKDWLKEHPEIDLFSLVPEDSPVWDTSPESRRLGSIPDRHARFVNQVLSELKSEFPNLKVMLPAYQALIRPPEGIPFEENAMVGVAMIRRDNTRHFYDISSQKNLYYLNYLWQWQDSGAVQGQISLGGYYRRYAFRSLPLVNYTVMASDLKYASLIGLAGLGEYGEPGDWFTFELTHLLTARLSWSPSESVDRIIDDYTSLRFGPAAEEMKNFLFLLDSFSGQIIRGFGNYTGFDSDTPFPELGVQGIVLEPARAYMRHLQLCRSQLIQAQQKAKGNPPIAKRIEKWMILLDYLRLETQAKSMTEALSSSAPYGQLLDRINQIYKQMDDLVEAHRGKGMFLLEDRRMNYLTRASKP